MPAKELELVIVLVFADHLVGDDPGADDRQNKQNDHNKEGGP